ncbi:hypothetical protein QTP88_019246 [Uroleucon formosanum]
MPPNETTKKTKLFASPNRYSVLSNTVESDDNDVPPKSLSQEPSDTTTHASTKVSLPPPIFIKGVLNYSALLSELTELIGPSSFVCKSTSTHLKVQAEKSDDYRKIIHFLNENNASFHTYQLQSEKSYRVVIRNLHPSTPTTDISSAIEEIGFSTRQVTNIKHHQTKMALPMFFVDLEPDPSNKDIFNVKSILHTLVKVEEPHKRRDIPQCLNCQSYGHTRAYCSYPPRCVKCAVYSPPKHKISPARFTEIFSTFNNNYIIGGDLNAKHQQWGCRASNPRGNSLLQSLLTTNSTVIAPPNHTYWPNSRRKMPDILDIFVTKIPRNLHTQIFNLIDPCSDHSPVMLSLDCLPQAKVNPSALSQFPIDWDKFSTILSEKTCLKLRLKTPSDIDDAVNLLTTNIQTSVWNSAKPVPLHVKPSPHLPSYIRTLIAQKRRARVIWQRTRYPIDKSHYNALTQKLKRLLANLKSESYAKYISSLTDIDGSLWKVTRKLLRIHNPPPTLRNADGSWALSEQSQANIFANHLSNTFQPHHNIISPTKIQEVVSFLNSPLPMYPPPRAFYPSEVEFNLKKKSPNKSPGFDLISTEVVKHLPRKTIIFLTQIYNAMLRLSYFPILWKYSIIILIPKPKKPPDCPSSYRPISLLPTLSKLFEKLLLKRILPIVDEAKILPDSQFGFRNSHSTIHQVHRLVDKISFALEEKLYCTGAFLDVSQAFDRVWHSGLLYKLKLILPSHYYLILKSYLEDRFFSVRVGSSFSSPTEIKAGVPQGAVIAPLLFNLYISDQPTSPHTLVGDFADDKAILATSPDPVLASSYIQDHLFSLESWYKTWGVKMNETKSIHGTFALRHGVCPTLYLNNQPLPPAQCIRYLGILIDRRLTWKPHIISKTRTLNDRFRLLRPLLTSKHMKLSNKLLLYKLLLRPIWTYGIQLWGAAKISNINRIQRFQSKTLRTILKAPFYVSNHTLHSDLKIPFVSELAKTHYKRFNSRLAHHKNPLISNLSSASIPGSPVKRLKRQWCRDLLA